MSDVIAEAGKCSVLIGGGKVCIDNMLGVMYAAQALEYLCQGTQGEGKDYQLIVQQASRTNHVAIRHVQLVGMTEAVTCVDVENAKKLFKYALPQLQVGLEMGLDKRVALLDEFDRTVAASLPLPAEEKAVKREKKAKKAKKEKKAKRKLARFKGAMYKVMLLQDIHTETNKRRKKNEAAMQMALEEQDKYIELIEKAEAKAREAQAEAELAHEHIMVQGRRVSDCKLVRLADNFIAQAIETIHKISSQETRHIAFIGAIEAVSALAGDGNVLFHDVPKAQPRWEISL